MIIHAYIKYQGSLHVVVQINANVKIVNPWGSKIVSEYDQEIPNLLALRP